MAATLDPTVSGPNANSWVDDTEFTGYIDARAGASAAVLAADPGTRANALVMAAQLIVQLTRWDPERVSLYEDGRVEVAVAGQALPLPARQTADRNGTGYLSTTVNPAFAKRAQMEQAIALIDDVARVDDAARDISKVKVDVVEVSFDDLPAGRDAARAVLSDQAKRELSFWALGFGDDLPGATVAVLGPTSWPPY